MNYLLNLFKYNAKLILNEYLSYKITIMKINEKKFVSFLNSLKIKEKFIILHVTLINHPSLIDNIENFLFYTFNLLKR